MIGEASRASCRWVFATDRVLVNFLIGQVQNSMADWCTASRKLIGIDPLAPALKLPLAGRVRGAS